MSRLKVLSIFVTLLFVLLLPLRLAHAADFNIGTGSSVNLGTASLTGTTLALNNSGLLSMGSANTHQIFNFLNNAGSTTQAGAGIISVIQNWQNSGVFNPDTRQVIFSDDSATSQLSGNTNFFGLSATTANGNAFVLEAGSVQTVLNDLMLTGAAGNLLSIESSSPGSQAFLSLLPGANQSVDFVRVSDNHASSQLIAPGSPASFNSIQGTNVFNWFLGNISIAIPTTSISILVCLSLLLLLTVYRQRKYIFNKHN